MQIIEIEKQNQLPKGIEMQMYDAPYYKDPLEMSKEEFRLKHGHEPKKAYELGNQIFMPIEEIK